MKAIGKYHLIAEIKRGEHGATYRGWDAERQRVVLLKTFKRQSTSRFAQEAEAYARVSHDNVVQLWDYGIEHETCYLALEFVEGQDLRRVLQRALPVEIAVAILCEARLGLAEIHRQNIIHRDLKPENILLSHEGKVKLCDFDLALSGDAANSGPGISGSPGYVAPEIILGESVTAAADFFSLGVVLYEMLTGARPFQAGSSSGEMNAIVRLAPMPLAQFAANIPPALEAFLTHMLAKSPSDRRANLEELARDFELGNSATREQLIRKYLAAPEEYQAVGLTPRVNAPVRKHVRRRSWLYAASAASLVGVIALGLSLRVRDAPLQKVALPPRVAVDSTQQIKIATPAEKLPAPSNAAKPQALSQKEEPESTHAVISAPPSTRQFFLRSIPWAFLSVNGDSLGMTPRAVTLRADETPQLVLRNPQFPHVELSLSEVAQLADTVTISLWERVAQLELQITPWAEVYINNEKRVLAEGEKSLLLLPGRYNLRFVHPQLGEKTETLSLRAGEVRRLQVNMF